MMFPHPTAPSRQDPLPETSIQFYSSFCFVRTRTPWMMKLSTDLWQNVEHVANIANFRTATKIYYLNLQLHSPSISPGHARGYANRFKWTSVFISAIPSACFTHRQKSPQIRPQWVWAFPTILRGSLP